MIRASCTTNCAVRVSNRRFVSAERDGKSATPMEELAPGVDIPARRDPGVPAAYAAVGVLAAMDSAATTRIVLLLVLPI